MKLKTSVNARKIDPVLTEIVRNGVVAITEEMKTNLMRSAYSMIIYEAQDFTVGLFDARGDTVSIGIGLPMFTRGMSDVVKAMIAHFGTEGMHSGDVLGTNDAYLTGSHLNHVTLAVPIFDGRRLAGFTACMAHWQDIGGALNTVTRDIYSEGLQLPMVKVHRRGKVNQDIVDIIRMNVRLPERGIGDLKAQIAAVQTGGRRFGELMGRYGSGKVLGAIAAIMDHSESAARRSVAAIPDGMYEAESYMDDDAVNLGQRVPIRVKVTVKGEQMTVDLSEISAQVQGFYNSGEAAGRACCEVAFKCLTSATERPINDGSFRPLRIILPKGRVVSAQRPAPMQRWMTYPMTVVDTIIKALAPAIPDRVIAAHHADLMTVMINGRMPGSGALFLFLGGLVGGGWGATGKSDGSSATICINDGDTHNSPVEQVEAKYPLIVEHYRLRDDSGGAGTWRGGLGVDKSHRVRSEFNFNAQVERVYCRPWGLFGGHPGAGNQVAVRTAAGEEIRFPSGKVQGRVMQSGDAYILRSGGGGGYGSPLDRPLERIAADVAQGYVSRLAAERCYGVAFGAHGKIDADATAALRAKLLRAGVFIFMRDNEDAGDAAQLNAAKIPNRFFTKGRLFPLRCC